MTTTRCIGEPISWLRLERYHLGEVDDAERAEIADHLASCPACASAHGHLAADDAIALPPLPVATPARRAPGLRTRRAVVVVTSGLALAAAVLLSVQGPGRHEGVTPGTLATRTKGDAVAFSLVRDDDERIEEAGGIFHEGDRFKAIVSCPPSMDATFDLVVYDASGASFPLAPARLACGNGVPMPGAFRLSGSREEKVCLVWQLGAEPTVERSVLSAGAPASRSLCKQLTTARPE